MYSDFFIGRRVGDTRDDELRDSALKRPTEWPGNTADNLIDFMIEGAPGLLADLIFEQKRVAVQSIGKFTQCLTAELTPESVVQGRLIDHHKIFGINERK